MADFCPGAAAVGRAGAAAGFGNGAGSFSKYRVRGGAVDCLTDGNSGGGGGMTVVAACCGSGTSGAGVCAPARAARKPAAQARASLAVVRRPGVRGSVVGRFLRDKDVMRMTL